MTAATFHIYGTKAYRSEIALFRAERVSAGEAEQFEAPMNARELYRVDGAGGPIFSLDMVDALAIFVAAGAERLVAIEVTN